MDWFLRIFVGIYFLWLLSVVFFRWTSFADYQRLFLNEVVLEMLTIYVVTRLWKWSIWSHKCQISVSAVERTVTSGRRCHRKCVPPGTHFLGYVFPHPEMCSPQQTLIIPREDDVTGHWKQNSDGGNTYLGNMFRGGTHLLVHRPDF